MLCAKNTEHGLKSPHFPSISSYISNKMEKANIAFDHLLVSAFGMLLSILKFQIYRSKFQYYVKDAEHFKIRLH